MESVCNRALSFLYFLERTMIKMDVYLCDFIIFLLGCISGWNLCRIYDQISKKRQRKSRRKQKGGIEYSFPNLGDLWDFYEEANRIVEAYGRVTISDLNDLSGKSSKYLDNKWGWATLKVVNISKDKTGGYRILFPKSELIPLE